MTDPDVWSYRDTVSSEIDRSDLVGFDVEATDGDIGKLDELSTETDRHYLVVDTGFWIFGKKRLVPASVVTRVDHTDRKVYVSMTKEQIKSAPDFDDQRTTADDDYYDEHGSYYSGYGWK